MMIKTHWLLFIKKKPFTHSSMTTERKKIEMKLFIYEVVSS